MSIKIGKALSDSIVAYSETLQSTLGPAAPKLGSPAVQVEMLTGRIREIRQRSQSSSTDRVLQKLESQRRAVLEHVKRVNKAKYEELAARYPID